MTTDSGRRYTANRRTISRTAATLIATAALGASFATQAMAAAEHALAGIRVFSTSSAVLRKYGSPDEVRVGQLTTGGAPAGGAAGAGGPGGYPGSGGPSRGGASYPGAGGGGASYPGGGGESGAPGQLPGLPGGDGESGSPTGYPGAGGPSGYPGSGGPGGGYPGAGGGGSQSGMAVAQRNSVTWIYDRPDGGSLEFTMSSDGRVVQIHASGFKGAVRTDKGVALGMSLAQVNAKYGYPEAQFITGKILTETYTERSHAAFQFYNGKLVGIIVAAVE
jgi:hypothetical protein